MKINLISVGHKMPHWVADGFVEYQQRLPKDYQLHLISLKPQTTIEKEGELLLNAIPEHSTVVALDRTGQTINTLELAAKLQAWHDLPTDLSILIGGAEGMSAKCLQRAQHIWSLSALTLPHQLVRIVIAEQLYRAWTVLNRHPYHK